MMQNEYYLLATVGFDTAENDPQFFADFGKFQKIIIANICLGQVAPRLHETTTMRNISSESSSDSIFILHASTDLVDIHIRCQTRILFPYKRQASLPAALTKISS